MFNSATQKLFPSRLLTRAVLGGLVAITAVAFAPPPALAPVALGIDFRQAANDGPPLGDIAWINSILQQNNSFYAEGMSVPQRLVFVEIPATTGNNHRLTFSHQATKGGGIHAYDFLTSWDQAITAAEGKGPAGEDVLFSLADPDVICGPALGPQVTQGICDSLWDPTQNPVIATGDLPDNMGSIGMGTMDVAQQVSDYEASLGNRQITLRAPNGNPVSSVVVNFLGYTVGSDNYAEYELLWTSASTTIAVEFAGHLSVGDPDGIVSGYGTDWGASSISGGPYHFKLAQLDGASLGSQDNQIKGADIIIPPPPCDIDGPVLVCQGDTGLVFTDLSGNDSTFVWSLLGADAGTMITSGQGTGMITVSVGAGEDGFTVQLSKTNAGGTTVCDLPVTVNQTTVAGAFGDEIACDGDDVTFCTTASGTGPFTYQWSKDGSPLSGETNSCLTLPDVDESDEATYCVDVTGFCNTDTECADLTVNQPVVVATIPDDEACDGDDVTFCASASGTGPLTYQWTKDGVDMPGETNSCLTLTGVDETDEATYCAEVTNSCNTDTECADLTVNQPVVAGTIDDEERCTGEDVTFCATATGSGPFTYQWTKDGADLPGETNSCLTLMDVMMSDEATYCAEITNVCNTDTTCADLTLQEGTSATTPDDATACPGDDVTFCTTASGAGPFTYQWSKDGSPLSGETTSCLTLMDVAESAEGEYCVAVTGECNTDTECADLVVNAPTVAGAFDDETRCEGESVTFCTTASGTGPFTYQWSKDGNSLSGETNSCLTVMDLDQGDEGEYCVLVTGECNSDTECADLTVLEPTVAGTFGDETRCEGESVTFCTTASGTGPFTYQWSKDGNPLNGETNSCLNVTDLDQGDEGEYCVLVTGECNSDTECADLTVDNPTVATDPSDAMVCPGEDVMFCTVASGTGPFTYQWSKDGLDLPGETNSCLSLPSVELDAAGEYCVDVTGECNTDTQCADLDVMLCTEVFCTFTQGFYGNAGGKFNGVGTFDLLVDLLSSGPLVVGKLGDRSLTIPTNGAQCIIDRLPAGGTAATLPDAGDQTMSGPPACSVPVLPLKNGKFKNILLGQTVTLSLNLRLDPDLGDLELCNMMTTQAVLPGPDGLFGTDDDVPDPGPDGLPDTGDEDVFTVLISPSVISALGNLGLPTTVSGLLELANRALAGLATGGANLSAINGAVDAINRGFDECRLLVSCETST